MDVKSPVAEARNEYTYSATGNKLKVVQKSNPNYSTTPVIGTDINISPTWLNKTTDYVGNIVYEDGALKRILVDGGYIEQNQYFYYITGHLGNNSLVLHGDGSVNQKNQYYPFGMNFANDPAQTFQPYKYNGKELDRMFGVNLYDYSARLYDPAIGRFLTPDPLAEKYYSISPYAYCLNNPIRYVDPTGMDTTHVNLNGDVYINLPGGEDIIVVDQPLPEVTITGSYPKSRATEVMAATMVVVAVLAADDMIGGVPDDVLIPPAVVTGSLIAAGFALYDAITKPSPPTAIVPPTANTDRNDNNNKEYRKTSSSAESDYGKNGKEHVVNTRPSTKGKHEEGRARNQRDRGGEKGDKRRTRYK